MDRAIPEIVNLQCQLCLNPSPFFLVLTVQTMSWCLRSLSTWDKTKIISKYFRMDPRGYLLNFVSTVYILPILGKSLDSWCSDYWKIHFSVKYIYAYQAKLSPRFLSSAPKQWEVIYYPEALFFRKYSPLPSRRGWGPYEKVNNLLLLSEVYSELCQTCRIELFAKILNDFEPLPIFAKLHLKNLAGLYISSEVVGNGFTLNT